MPTPRRRKVPSPTTRLPEQVLDVLVAVLHEPVDEEADEPDEQEPEARDHDDPRVLVGRGLAGHLQDAAVAPLPETLRPLLDPPLHVPALVEDLRHPTAPRPRRPRVPARSRPARRFVSTSRPSGSTSPGACAGARGRPPRPR